MCTVTIVPGPGSKDAFRMACSRDECHDRAPAIPPIQHEAKGVQCAMPIDPGSGGTWVGVNEYGVALTLLNDNPPDPPTERELSRGGVIPSLLHASSLHQVIEGLVGLDRERMMPFRLVACDGASVMLWRSIEPVERVIVDPWDGEPVMFTSSGLGDHLVEGPRRELFDGWFGEDPGKYADEQHAFHRHRWPGREHLSVCMHREDARTVSYTVVDRQDDRIRLTYHPDRPDRDAEDHRVDLRRRLAQR